MKGRNLRRSDGSVALLSGRVPNLRFDSLSIHLNHSHVHEQNILGGQVCLNCIHVDSYQINTDLDRPGGKLDPNCGLGLQVELVSCEPGQEV